MEREQKSFGWLTGPEIAKQVQRGGIVINPYNSELLNPNSYNYRLAPELKRIVNDVIDIKKEDDYEEIIISQEGTVLFPGECYLGCTIEVFGSSKYASLITGRSSVGRKFITNHITAGLIDIGFLGQITLEISVIKPTIVYPNIPFGQIYWFTSAGITIEYNGIYQHQNGPTVSRIHQSFNT